MLSVLMRSVLKLIVVFLIVMLSAIILNPEFFVMICVIKLSVAYCYAECHDGECRIFKYNAECCYAVCFIF